jgi:Ni2+-binding GTPase involved in maturation of urease and hydrogenase
MKSISVFTEFEGAENVLALANRFASNTPDRAVITKCDLAQGVGFDEPAMRNNIERRPGMPIFQVVDRTDKAWQIC